MKALFLCLFLVFALSHLVFSQTSNTISEDTAKAALLVRQGDSSQRTFAYDKAIDYYQKALDIRLPIFGKDNIQVGMMYNGIGYCYYGKGQFRTAVDYFFKTLAIRIKTFGNEHQDVAMSLTNIGNSYGAMGEVGKALDYHRRSLDMRIKVLGPEHRRVGDSYGNLALYNSHVGEYEKAIEYLRKAIAIYTKTIGTEHSDIAIAYENLGICFGELGQYNKAIDVMNRALRIRLKVLGPEDPWTAYSYENLGAVYTFTKEYDKSIENMLKCVAIRTKVLGEEHPFTIFTYQGLGVAYNEIGQYDKASAYLEKCIALRIKTIGEEHPNLAETYSIVGEIYASKGQLDKAIEAYKKSLTANRYRTPYKFDSVFIIINLSSTLQRYSRVLLRKYNETKELSYLNEAFDVSNQAVASVSEQFKTIYTEGSKANLMQSNFDVYENALATNTLLANVKDDKQLLLESFSLSERAKSLILFESVRENNARSFSGIPKDLLQKEQNLRLNITWHEKQRHSMTSEGVSEMDSSFTFESNILFNLQQQYDSLITHFKRDYPNYYHLRYDRRTMTVSEVQKEILKPKQTLLEYFAGDSTITIFTIRPDKYEVTTVKNDFGLDSLVRQLRTSLTTDRSQGARRYSEAASLLYQKLIAPVKAQLTEEVIIIPDGILSYIPFEALLVEPPKEVVRFKTHHYLLRDHRISYCFSATLLREMMQKKHATPPTVPLMAFAPFFEGDTVQLSTLFSNDADIAERDATTLAPLKYTGEEAYKVASLLKGDAIVGKAATEARFTEGVSKARIIHLATHAKADDRSGDYSYLAFAPQKDTIQNELVYVRDLYNLRLNADLVVLSACETGVGKLQRGEGVISLARAFAYSGAKAIVTSIWSVNDAKTKELMVFFYQNLKRGQPKNEALRQAKLTYLATHEAEACHPYFWSGFIGIGEHGAVR